MEDMHPSVTDINVCFCYEVKSAGSCIRGRVENLAYLSGLSSAGLPAIALAIVWQVEIKFS